MTESRSEHQRPVAPAAGDARPATNDRDELQNRQYSRPGVLTEPRKTDSMPEEMPARAPPDQTRKHTLPLDAAADR